jgi:ubiquinone/menaquinone biosynthesis C-methylase UbiE
VYNMNPTNLFSSRAKDYALYRPGYPQSAITIILEGLGESSQLVAADIGAGTGIASQLLGERGVKVIAIEPNEEMRMATTPHPMVELRAGTAEATNLPSASVNLITCFQSFHWFNPEPTLFEFHRILKPSGRLALVWGIWDENDPFTKELDHIVLQASNNTPGLPAKDSMVNNLSESPYFKNLRKITFPYQQWLNLSGLIGLVRSQGFVELSGEKQQKLATQLQKLYEQSTSSDGIRVVYQTDIYLVEAIV